MIELNKHMLVMGLWPCTPFHSPSLDKLAVCIGNIVILYDTPFRSPYVHLSLHSHQASCPQTHPFELIALCALPYPLSPHKSAFTLLQNCFVKTHFLNLPSQYLSWNRFNTNLVFSIIKTLMKKKKKAIT